MSNKNAFELRTDILAMAKDYMDQQQTLTMEFGKRAFQSALDAQKVTEEAWKSYVPPMYTIEDLMNKAQEMYSFVNKKD